MAERAPEDRLLEGLVLLALAERELKATPDTIAPFLPLDRFIALWLPKMLHAPITSVSVQIGQEVKSFAHLPLRLRTDWAKFPEAERRASKMLVRWGQIDLTPKNERHPQRGGGSRRVH